MICPITPLQMISLASILARVKAELKSHAEEAKSIHSRFFANDESGQTWTVGLKNQTWNRREGNAWVLGTPPQRLQMEVGLIAEIESLEKQLPQVQTNVPPARQNSSSPPPLPVEPAADRKVEAASPPPFPSAAITPWLVDPSEVLEASLASQARNGASSEEDQEAAKVGIATGISFLVCRGLPLWKGEEIAGVEPGVCCLTSYRLVIGIDSERQKLPEPLVIPCQRIRSIKIQRKFSDTIVNVGTDDGTILIPFGDINWTPLEGEWKTLAKKAPWTKVPLGIVERLDADSQDPEVMARYQATPPHASLLEFYEATQAWWDKVTEPGWWRPEEFFYLAVSRLEEAGVYPLPGEVWLPQTMDRNQSPFQWECAFLCTNYRMAIHAGEALVACQGNSGWLVLPLEKISKYKVSGSGSGTVLIEGDFAAIKTKLKIPNPPSEAVVNKALKSADWMRLDGGEREAIESGAQLP